MNETVLKIVKTSAPFAVTLIIGAGIGWSLRPSQVKVEEKVKVVEVEKQVVVEKEVIRVEIVRIKDTSVVERWHREKTEERRPDGTVIASEVEDRNIDTVVKEKENSTQVKIVEVERQVVVEKERLVEKKITPVLAQWHVGVLGGGRLDISTMESTWVIGVEVERRIAGPVFAGAWTVGGPGTVVGGVKLGLEF
jgi:hypothetical protein